MGRARHSGVTNTTPEPRTMAQSARQPPCEQIPSATGYGDRRRFFWGSPLACKGKSPQATAVAAAPAFATATRDPISGS